MTRKLRLLALAAAFLGACDPCRDFERISKAFGGCDEPCEDLAKRICACLPAGGARDACDREVKTEILAAHTSRQQDDECRSLLGVCPNPDRDPGACDFMKTEAGKVACGLAYPP